jgi:hypothetical protein
MQALVAPPETARIGAIGRQRTQVEPVVDADRLEQPDARRRRAGDPVSDRARPQLGHP